LVGHAPALRIHNEQQAPTDDNRPLPEGTFLQVSPARPKMMATGWHQFAEFLSPSDTENRISQDFEKQQ
jgi:hypothetical protein